MKIWLTAIVFSVLLLVPLEIQDSFALPTTLISVSNEPRCDDLVVPLEVDELGLFVGGFPADERIAHIENSGITPVACDTPAGVDDKLMTNKVLEIRNDAGRTFSEVWYVADRPLLDDPIGFSLDASNYDGLVNDRPAFRIDSIGNNRPLVLETMNSDNMFEPGEIWFFSLQDSFLNPGNIGDLTSLGVGSASVDSIRPSVDPSTGSIIAIELDSDGDGTPDSQDGCPEDPNKTEPGVAGCGNSDQVIGGEIIPLDTTALLLAGAQSSSWMIPVILSGIGIGLFVFRRSENS